MGGSEVITSVSALIAVLAAILVLRLLLQRFGLDARPGTSQRIRVLESRMIGGQGRLHLVEVDDRQLLLGSSEHGVSLLRDCGPAAPDASRTPAAGELPGVGTSRRRTWRLLAFVGLLVLLPLSGLGEELSAAPATALIEVPAGIAAAGGASALDLLALLTVLAIAPSILLMTTCFTRFVIVLSFVRQAIGVQHMPPNQVLIGLALFLTAFVMAPVAQEVATVAYEPYSAGELTTLEALEKASGPVREFLLSQTREEDLALFMELSRMDPVEDLSEIPLTTVMPSFLVSELRTAFEIGFLVFLPFLIIDLFVSSLLISMGMIVLPPIVVSLPFKIMLFVLVDGWNLILGSLVQGIA